MNTLTYVELHREPGNPHHDMSSAEREITGWAPLPDELIEKFYACKGYCNLTVVDGVITGLVPDENPPTSLYETKRLKQIEIDAAKASLTATDYQVLKAYEASIQGEPMPYDMDSVIAERQALRDTVNAAEAEQKAAQDALDAYYEAANKNREAWH